MFTSIFPEKLSQLAVRAKLATLATQLAGRNNPRAFAGILLIVAGPVVKYIYLRFDPAGGDPLSYWNAHFFLHAIRGDLAAVLYATGFGMLIAEKNKLRVFILLPLTESLGRIVWMAFVSNNTQFHAVMPWAFGLIGFAASLLWFMMFDWIMNLLHHKHTQPIKTTFGAAECEALSDSQFRTIAKQQGQIYKALK